jgi:Fic family protein
MGTDIQADIYALDRGEHTSLMEPLLLSSSAPRRGELADMALELAQKSAGLRRSLPPSVVSSLATLVRSMNCYYSNFIEGHDTHPVEIERALKGDYNANPEKRDLQLEATAHITVQRWIDEGGLPAREAIRPEGIREVHRRFCQLLPEEMLWVEDPRTGERIRVEGGALRRRDVQVGRHVAISPGAVPRFLDRLTEAFAPLGGSESILAAAGLHHRLVWIHPFMDGNGRVARLISHAFLLDWLQTGAVWSVARGLARNVDRYKDLLANCDLPRRNDLDGRGALSEEALAEFTRFFLGVCIDQVDFMESLVKPDGLRARILLWAAEETKLGKLPAKSSAILEAILYRGELPRGEVQFVVGTTDRQARRFVAALQEKQVLTAEGTREPLRLAFPASLASRWMPGLFPEQRG